MELQIKQLKQNDQIFVPLTVAEAVLVKNGTSVIRLDEALSLKSGTIITPDDSGLKSLLKNNQIIITHSNIISPVKTTLPLLIAYDLNGHITKSDPINLLNVKVNTNNYIKFDGSEEQTIKLGDDFELDESNNIKLNWIEHGDT